MIDAVPAKQKGCDVRRVPARGDDEEAHVDRAAGGGKGERLSVQIQTAAHSLEKGDPQLPRYSQALRGPLALTRTLILASGSPPEKGVGARGSPTELGFRRMAGVRWGLVGFVVTGLASIIATSALAGPYFGSSSPLVARPGQLVTLRAGAGERLAGAMPLYLVPSSHAPLPYACGVKAICAPMVLVAPNRPPYVRIGTVDVRHAPGNPSAGYDVTVRFRVPARTAPGHYAYVVYCRWCAPKGKGSLIAWPLRLDQNGAAVAGSALTVR